MLRLRLKLRLKLRLRFLDQVRCGVMRYLVG